LKKSLLFCARAKIGWKIRNARNRYCVLHLAFWIFLLSVIVFAYAFIKEDGTKYLQNVTDKFSGINDYTVNVRVHFDLDNVKAPDMAAKVYYKTPDKVKIDSKGTFLLPKEVGVFNPRMFSADNFDVNVDGNFEYDGHPAVRLSLYPKKESFRSREIYLTIDEKEWLIKEISIEPARGSVMDGKISYGNFGGFELPSEINVNLNLPPADSTQSNSNPRRQFRGGLTGSVEIYYSNYKVNSGLSDSFFVKKTLQ